MTDDPRRVPERLAEVLADRPLSPEARAHAAAELRRAHVLLLEVREILDGLLARLEADPE